MRRVRLEISRRDFVKWGEGEFGVIESQEIEMCMSCIFMLRHTLATAESSMYIFEIEKTKNDTLDVTLVVVVV